MRWTEATADAQKVALLKFSTAYDMTRKEIR